MKKTIAMIMVAGFVGTAGIVAAAGEQPADPAAEQPAAAIESNLEKAQQSFSGLVKETDKGLVLETQEGTYMLKGMSLEEIVGKEVYVTGVVKEDADQNTIYVVKADVKE